MKTAIIGAGMAGLSCASLLAASGHQVTVFDKGRGPGGRMATRRAELSGQTIRFDHGAQYFTARDPEFIAVVQEWANAGRVADWPAAGPDAVVGTPGMNAPIKAMAEPLGVQWGARIEAIARSDGRWRVSGEAQDDNFDALVIAVPAEQVAALISKVSPEFAAAAGAVTSDPCWAVMAAFGNPLPIKPDVITDTGKIAWAARNSAKPGRDDALECWVIHASAEYSRSILELPAQDAAEHIWQEFARQNACPDTAPEHLSAHRWRYAKVPPAKRLQPTLYDADLKLAVAGDWLSGPRVENAFLSGRAAARALLSG